MKTTSFTFNPSFLTDEALLASFSVRQAELEQLLRVFREPDAPSNPHQLVVAPRGYGKTTLVQRVKVALRREPELAARWLPISFGEESYEVTTAGELWLEAILHVADAVGDELWLAHFETLRRERDADRMLARALSLLRALADSRGQRLVLIIENLQQLFDQLADEREAWRLREVWMNDPRFLVLGTALHRFEGISEPTAPCYELFRVTVLPPLDTHECAAIWSGLHHTDIGLRRARALRILTGGNPRLLVMLVRFAGSPRLEDLLHDLTRLIDDHTEYFRNNIEALEGKMRRVFLAVADLWEPASSAAVAELARLPNNEVSVMLERLVRDGRLDETTRKKRGRRYQVAERLYNIYYLMRRRNGPPERVRAVVDFLHRFYDHDDLAKVVSEFAAQAIGPEMKVRPELWAVVGGVVDRVRDTATERVILEALGPEVLDAEDLPEEAVTLEAVIRRAEIDGGTWSATARLYLRWLARSTRSVTPDQAHRLWEAIRNAPVAMSVIMVEVSQQLSPAVLAIVHARVREVLRDHPDLGPPVLTLLPADRRSSPLLVDIAEALGPQSLLGKPRAGLVRAMVFEGRGKWLTEALQTLLRSSAGVEDVSEALLEFLNWAPTEDAQCLLEALFERPHLPAQLRIDALRAAHEGLGADRERLRGLVYKALAELGPLPGLDELAAAYATAEELQQLLQDPRCADSASLVVYRAARHVRRVRGSQLQAELRSAELPADALRETVSTYVSACVASGMLVHALEKELAWVERVAPWRYIGFSWWIGLLRYRGQSMCRGLTRRLLAAAERHPWVPDLQLAASVGCAVLGDLPMALALWARSGLSYVDPRQPDDPLLLRLATLDLPGVRKVLAEHPEIVVPEPMTLALARLAGEDPSAPLEISEIAEDLVRVARWLGAQPNPMVADVPVEVIANAGTHPRVHDEGPAGP